MRPFALTVLVVGVGLLLPAALPADDQAEAGRIYRKICYGPLLDVFMLDMRSYRTANANGDGALIFGATQLAWLKRELVNSQATWKVIAADLPIGLISSWHSRAASNSRTLRSISLLIAAASARARFSQRARCINLPIYSPRQRGPQSMRDRPSVRAGTQD